MSITTLTSLADVAQFLNERGIENTFTGFSVNCDWCTIAMSNGMFRVLEGEKLTITGAKGLIKMLVEHDKSEAEILQTLYEQASKILSDNGLTWDQLKAALANV